MNNQKKAIWFPAKKYGWGWGFPVTWQGWCFLVTWIVILLGGIALFPSLQTSFYGLLAFIIIMASALIAVCFIKGEKPRWRWGD